MASVNAIEVLRERLRPFSMGGELMDGLLGDARIQQLALSRSISLELGKGIPAVTSELNEKRAKTYEKHIALEHRNLDWKLSGDVSLPTETELRDAFVDEEVMIVMGNTTSNPRMREMVMVEFDRGDGTPRRLRASHPHEEGDRRWNENTTIFGRFALNHLGQIVDVHTHEVIERDNLPREQFIVNEESQKDPNFLLIQSSRYIWNLVKGNKIVNPNPIDRASWVPDVKDKEWNLYTNFAMEVPFLVMDGEINESTLDEFRNRMMACFCINPKLFLNLTNHFHFSAIFPYFEKHEQIYTFFEDVENIPSSPEEFDSFLREVMGDDCENSLSPLGNVAHMFGIGIGGWDRNSELM